MTFDEQKREQIARATDLMKTLSHPLRMAILCCLMDEDELSAGDIVARLEHMASHSQISQYLGHMRQQDLVTTRRDGQVIYYRLASEIVSELIGILYVHYCQ